MKDEPTPQIAETIVPLATPKKNGGAGRDNSQHRSRVKVLALACLLMVLVIAGGWLLYFLSKSSLQPEKTSTSPLPIETDRAENTIEPPAKPPPGVVPARLETEKTAAEQKLAEYLAAKSELERKAASEWGEDTYLEMTELGRQADAKFMENHYRLASELYERAGGLAGELKSRTDAVFRQLLAEGRKALDDGNGTRARHNFSLALKIAPADAGAQHGLKRAETVEAIMELIHSGEQHEANKAWSLAHSEYSKALEIDPDSEKARRRLDRVNGLIKEEQFQQLMSEGLAAFHRSDYKTARAHLLTAESLTPGSREVSDALSQVNQAIRLSDIDKLRRSAQTAERSEDWQRALKSYLAVLEIDKNLKFAVHGKERALEHIRIAKRIHFFLSSPQVLESDSQLKNAVLLLEEAGKVSPRGPRLAADIKKLGELVDVAQTPVKIAIESDNLTHVAVYRVGKLGRFAVHELELRPGTYTVVGTRDGYQDVRQKIVVKPGLQSLRVTVKCRVKI